MNNAWHSFLNQQGARVEDGKVIGFGDPASEPKAALHDDVLYDLTHLALIRASGEEASDFLQGQLSNDIRQVNESHHQLSSYCNPKGRILALFRLFQRDGDFLLRLPAGLLEPTLKRLRMFVLRSKVQLEHEQALVGFGLSGPNSETLLREQLGALPALADEAVVQQGITVLRVAGPQPRFELYGEQAAMASLWNALAAACRPIGAAGEDLLEIHAGLPSVLPENSEAFVPQMLNLQLVNGVNFKKGCYTGQEVVARMQYLGKLKRRMYLAHSRSPLVPLAGSELNSPQSASGQGAGRIVLAAPTEQGGHDLLIVAEVAVCESGQLFLEGDEQHPLEFLPLPYPLT